MKVKSQIDGLESKKKRIEQFYDYRITVEIKSCGVKKHQVKSSFILHIQIFSLFDLVNKAFSIEWNGYFVEFWFSKKKKNLLDRKSASIKLDSFLKREKEVLNQK